jgi:diguanylate cyclase
VRLCAAVERITMADQPIELGLARPLDRSGGPLARLLDQVLELVAEQAADGDTPASNGLAQRIHRYREELRQDRTPADLQRLSEECASACRDVFRRSAAFNAERDAEIKGLIETLTTAIDKLAGEAVSVNKQLTGHSDRFHRLVDLEDIRDLKRRISQEVAALNRFVSEKQEREDAYYSKLTKKIEVLQARLVESEEAASTDPLTQIANRGTFDRTLGRWLAAAQQSDRPFVLAILDIDNFKRVNDTFGHPVGDRVLLAAARTLSTSMRQGDLVARFGGEEFAVLMADTSLRQAEPRLRDVVQLVAAGVYEFEHQGRPERLSYTLSAGATERAADDTADAIVKRADEGLYDAKKRGKNCVVCKRHSIFSRILGS